MMAACQRWASIQATAARVRTTSQFGLFLFVFLLLFFLDAI